MLRWQQIALGQGLLNHFRHVVIGRGRRRGLYIDDQVRSVRIACLCQMDFVADPFQSTLGAVARLRVVRRSNELSRRRHIRYLSPTQLARLPSKLLRPQSAQYDHRWYLRQPGFLLCRIDCRQQLLAIGCDHPRQVLAGSFRFGQMVVFRSTAVTLIPLRWRKGPKPIGSHHGKLIQCGAQRLHDTFQPIEGADGGHYMSRIGALATTRFDQVEFFEAVEQRVQQQQFGVSRNQAGAKLAQHGVVKTRIGELQGQSILPVNATAYGIGGLPVRKVLDKLKERNQGQASRGFGRLTTTWKQACELGIAENTAECVDDVKAKSALGKGGAGNSSRLYRDQKSGLSTKRHL